MTEPTIRSLFTFKIPDCWTPDQALAIVEFIGDLREAIWAHYHDQLIDVYREQHYPILAHHRPARRPAMIASRDRPRSRFPPFAPLAEPNQQRTYKIKQGVDHTEGAWFQCVGAS